MFLFYGLGVKSQNQKGGRPASSRFISFDISR